jgi:hypothetical protein
VQPDVDGLGQQRHQRVERVPLAGGEELVVVDDDERLLALPPEPVAQLLRCHVAARKPVAEELGQRTSQFGRGLCVGGVVGDPLVWNSPRFARR